MKFFGLEFTPTLPPAPRIEETFEQVESCVEDLRRMAGSRFVTPNQRASLLVGAERRARQALAMRGPSSQT